MVQKESYGSNTFAVTRIGEIQSGTNPKDRCCVAGEKNKADWLTRGKKPNENRVKHRVAEGSSFLEVARV